MKVYHEGKIIAVAYVIIERRAVIDVDDSFCNDSCQRIKSRVSDPDSTL